MERLEPWTSGEWALSAEWVKMLSTIERDKLSCEISG